MTGIKQEEKRRQKLNLMGFPECTTSKENSESILNITITEYLSGYKASPEYVSVFSVECTVLEDSV